MKKFECNYCHEKFSGFSIYDCPNCGSGDVCQIMDDKLCGFQPTGRSEDVPKPPKYNLNAEFWRTQWSEASGAHLMEYLRAEKLKKDNEILKKALTEIRANIEEHNQIYDLSVDTALLLEGIDGIAFDALAAIGGDDE